MQGDLTQAYPNEDRTQAYPNEDRSGAAEYLFGEKLVDRLPAAIYAACPGEGGSWLYASPRIADILGFTAAEFIDDPGLWARLIYPQDLQRVLLADSACLLSPDEALIADPVEYRMVRRDGQVIWVLDDSALARDEVHGFVHHGLLYDITDRKRNEMLLAGHAKVAEGIARGIDLVEVLVLLAEVADEISGVSSCVIELNQAVGMLVAGMFIPASLIVTSAGGRAVDPSYQSPVGGIETPFHLLDGTAAGRVILRYPAGSTVQDLDRELAAWTARMAMIAAMRAVEHGRMADSLALLAATLESTADGILVIDVAGRVVGHNRKLLDMWRLDEPVSVAVEADTLLQSVAQLLKDPAKLVMATPELSATDELELLDGRIFERYQHVEHGAAQDHRIGLVWSFRDVTAHRRMQQELRDQASNDPLTPLANRSYFVGQLNSALARAVVAKSTVAVLLLDLDDFKTVNDGLGYAAGDRLLIAVAERLRGCLRLRDTAARLGGDEFVILLQDLAEPAEAQYAAERILAAVSRPLTIDGQMLTIRASVGIAVFDGPEDAAELLRNADLAMYTAKRTGGSSCRRYVPGMHAEAVARMELKTDLERAINAEQLSVHYQPVVDLQSGRILGVEALVRWNHPIRGPIPPVDFIPLAEQTGLIERLGRWVLRQACTDTALWRRTIPGQEDLTVSVNLSPRQLSNVQFPDEVRRVLWSSGLPATALILEITESMLVEPGVDAVFALKELKHIGLSLALDDFGTGYSSLAQLIQYPLDVVKVDKSFVDHIDGDPANSALVQAVLHIAKALSLSVTVEGIETADQLRLLCEMGARRGQGYFMSRPLAAEPVQRLLEAINVASIVPGENRHLRLS